MSRLNELLSSNMDGRRLKPTVPGARPFRMDPEGAREAVLLLHGFTGHPGELAPLARALAGAGYAVYAPRYPGHGTCRRDFLQTKADDWVRRAYDAWLDLRSEYGTVHVAGHSMGGLIASAIAISFDVPRCILLAPAFEIAVKNIDLVPVLAPFSKVIVRNRQPSAFDLRDPVRRELQEEYWSDDLVSASAQLVRLQVLCRKNIHRLKSRTLVIVGAADRSVPSGVADYLREAAPKVVSFEARTISGAGHLFPFDDHADETVTLVLDWMSRPA